MTYTYRRSGEDRGERKEREERGLGEKTGLGNATEQRRCWKGYLCGASLESLGGDDLEP